MVVHGTYFGNMVKLAAVIQKAEVERGETYLYVKAQGTDSEDLLRIHSADPRALFQVHCCPPLCGQHETGDRLVHGKRVQLLVEGVAKEDWVNNLEAAAPHPDEREDELQALRRREKELAEMKAVEVKPGGEAKEGSSSS